MTPSERRFAPTTVRQPRNGVRFELEEVSAFIGMRNNLSKPIPSRKAHPRKPLIINAAFGP